jgi:TolB-like protein
VAITGIVALGGIVYWQFYVPSIYLPRGAGIASLAVVPFESLTPELDRSAFSRGLSDLLVADLSKLDRVQVLSPSTVRRYTWLGISTGFMGRLLGLEVLVEGTVQKVGERLAITARLVDVHTGKLIWAEDYDYPAADWGQLQAEAARKMAAQVGAHLAIHGQFPRSGR